MKRIEIGILLGAIVLYATAYGFMYAKRKPAANLTY